MQINIKKLHIVQKKAWKPHGKTFCVRLSIVLMMI
jgi:hypothetical protein